MLERIAGWLLRIAARNWVFLLLVGTIVSVVSYSLDTANWVKNDQGMLSTFAVGAVLGWLLARSRFKGWFAALYALVMSILAALEPVADFVPTLVQVFAMPVLELINELNLRAFQFFLRASGWIEVLRAGENIEDTGLFLLLFGFILALCGVWLMWAMIRQRRVLHGLLPIGVLLAINVHLSRQPLMSFTVFLLCSVLLVARTAFSRQHEDWQRRQVDYPDQLGIEWGMAAFVAALAIVLIARVGPFVGTPEGWQAVSKWLSERRQQTSDTAERLFAGVNTPPPPPVAATPQVFVNTPDLDEIGNPISQGYETVMWVTTSDPPPVPSDLPGNIPVQSVRIHYWRSAIYSRYTGRGWELAPMAGEPYPQPVEEIEPLEGRYLLRQDYQVVARTTGDLFSTNDPVQTTGGLALRATLADASKLVAGQQPSYSVISQATRVSANQLTAAPVDYPEEIRRDYLQLPESFPSRVRLLSQRLAGSAGDPYHKALRIQDYLRENFPYDLGAEPAPGQRDVVDYFLFDDQRGFCSHYATAMAVMLRAVGVPARVVTGYAMGEYIRERNAYRVALSASHAWVEVYFPGYGWIEFEPTAYRPVIEYPEDSTGLSGARPELDSPAGGPTRLEPYLAGLALAAALALLALPFLLLRMFSTTRQAPTIQVDTLYRRMRQALAWAGLAAVPSVTPDEYLAQYGGRLERYDQLQQALRQVTSLYRETVFSPRPPDALRVRIASQLWQQSLGDWLALWLRARWESFRGRRPGAA
jgi:transglutaminase-like putative cysteine protease